MKDLLGLSLLPLSMIVIGITMIIYSIVIVISEVFRKKEG